MRRVAAVVLAAHSLGAAAQVAPGTAISNQASVSGSMGANTVNVPSNTVTATVGTTPGVAFGARLESNTEQRARPGDVVFVAHTLTNTGSASDNYPLSAIDTAGGGWTFSSIAFFADADGNGQAAPNATLGTVAAPATGATGTVSASVGVLAPAQSATLYFCVRIDP